MLHQTCIGRNQQHGRALAAPPQAAKPLGSWTSHQPAASPGLSASAASSWPRVCALIQRAAASMPKWE